jgi:hypothetical protein
MLIEFSPDSSRRSSTTMSSTNNHMIVNNLFNRNPRNPNTYCCPHPYCGGMRSIDLRANNGYDTCHQGLGHLRALGLWDEIVDYSFGLGYYELVAKLRELLSPCLCQRHSVPVVVEPMATRMLWRMRWAAPVNVTRGGRS